MNLTQKQFSLNRGASRKQFPISNHVEGVHWLRKAAEQNNDAAQQNLGNCYYEGKGAATYFAETVKWWDRAAGQNLPAAQSNLAICYESGDGVANYEVEAYKWNLLAAAQGDTKAKRNASMLELMLSQEQIAEGKRRAQAWLDQRKNSSANSPLIP